jgi:uncharacterized protein YneF (UPF0154 family)
MVRVVLINILIYICLLIFLILFLFIVKKNLSSYSDLMIYDTW